MQNSFWINSTKAKEIITKTQILNKGNFRLMSCYYNFLHGKGLAFQMHKDSEFQIDKLFKKNNFEYFVFEHDDVKELVVLPNEDIDIFTERIVSQISTCTKDQDVLNLIIKEM